MTALRVTLPRAVAIWLADRPACHDVFKCSMRSVDHNCIVIAAIPVAALGATSLGFQAVTQNIIHALKLWVLDVCCGGVSIVCREVE